MYWLAVDWSIDTSLADVGRRPETTENDENGGGDEDAAKLNEWAPRRVPDPFSRVTGVKTVPAAFATPGTDCTRASVDSGIVAASALVLRPSASCGVMTTSVPLFAVEKMPANVLLIVSVRM